MKQYTLLLFSLLATSGLFAQNTVKVSATKATDYGVAYCLPQTAIKIKAHYTKTTRIAGEYYAFAERYLSITTAIAANSTSFSLDKIESRTIGIPDKEKSYLVEFKSGTVAPFLSLTSEGLLCAINSDYTFPVVEEEMMAQEEMQQWIDPKSFLSEEILRAGSTAKQAELIAKQIYRLRESRTNILTGEADNMPPDGNAYKLVIEQLEEQEKALISLFTGTEFSQTATYELMNIPDASNIDKKILFRFSTKLGVVEADNLTGEPVYISLKNKNPRAEPLLTLKEQQELEKKFTKGVIYNIPSKGELQIVYNNKTYLQQEYDIVQYGIQEVLSPKQFENKKIPIKIIFYPELGAIKQIIE